MKIAAFLDVTLCVLFEALSI